MTAFPEFADSTSSPKKPATRHRCRDCEFMITLYREGWSLVDVGAQVGVSGGSVSNVLQQHDVARRRRGHPRGLKTLWAEEAIRTHQAGDTLRLIAARLNVSFERVRQVLRARGISTNRRKAHACNDACRIVLAASVPLAIPDLARQTGISIAVLRNKAERHGLRIRSVAEGPRMRHICGDACRVVPEALRAGQSIQQAFLHANKKNANSTAQRYRILHPEWPWPRPEWWLRQKP